MTCIFRHNKQKAKKEHKCSWCGEQIEIGETYYYQAGTYYGDFQVTKLHEDCDAACSEASYKYGMEDYEPYSYKRGTTEER